MLPIPRRAAARVYAALTLAMVALAACAERAPVAPADDSPIVPRLNGVPMPTVRISEFHYDDAGTDSDEKIEISGPAGTDLSGWNLVRFNGSTASAATIYTSPGLAAGSQISALPFPSGTIIPATCGDRGVLVISYAVDGLQNGTADGFALVNAQGAVVELLSYEGVFTVASNAAVAAGMTSTDVGVSENAVPEGQSLQRTPAGTWSPAAQNTFGACNDAGETPPPAVVATVTVSPSTATVAVGATTALSAEARDASSAVIPGTAFTWSSETPAVATVSPTGVVTGVAEGTATIKATTANGVFGTATITVNVSTPPTGGPVRFTEIHYDNAGTDVDERIEVEGPAGTDLTGWSIVLYNGNGGASYLTRALTGVIPATCGTRGVVVEAISGIQNGGAGTNTEPDGFALVNAQGELVEFLSYEGTFTATTGAASGVTSTSIGVAQDGAPVGMSLQRNVAGTAWYSASSSFGSCATDPSSGGSHSITIFGRSSSDPDLPIGYQDQLFATVRDANNVVVNTPVTWTTEPSGIATVDARGVMTALTAGEVVIRAEALGASRTLTLRTIVATASGTASYVGHTAFGDPIDNTPDDDYILRRTEFTSSWNPARGIPNWVAYNLEATHFGSQDRCDCFTFDPELPANFPRYTTADYTDAGTFAGYGIDRGHLARSFDRTSGSLDNARSFLFSNIIPQAANVNQGPWALFENHIGDLARLNNREVYIVTGATGSKGTVKNEGKITIPTHVWKVAVVLPRNQGLADVSDRNNAEVYAVIMRNDPDVTGGWEQYRTTVDAVETLSGYDLLSLLPDDLEVQIERGNRFPTAVSNGPWSISEGASVAFASTGSFDPDAGSTLSYAWNFGDGTASTSPNPSKTYAQSGQYTVTLTVTDEHGASHQVTQTATVSNAVPVVTLTPPATWTAGSASLLGVRFTDAAGTRDAPYTVRINWGDGTPITQFSSLVLPTAPLNRSKSYAAPGTYTIVVTVTDRDGGVGTISLPITVN
ncbi:MAG: DNA/RNA non-specific endonuclease [Gemmatimonadaceae bacterium]|nr:DNA/RNA non-specific endonuclease [Gemmatimonadaceae bacterium]